MMSRNHLLPAPSPLRPALTQATGVLDSPSVSHHDTSGYSSHPLNYVSFLSNSSTMNPIPTPSSSQQQEKTGHSSGKKRRRLEFVKCEYCRGAKQKCLPIERDPDTKCSRCVDKDLPCSEGTRASRKSRRSEVTTSELSTDSSSTLQVLGMELEDWVFLVSYRTIMMQAFESLQRLKVEMVECFNLEQELKSYVSTNADYLKLEKLLVTLDDFVLQGVQELAVTPPHPLALKTLTTLIAQTVSTVGMNTTVPLDTRPQDRVTEEGVFDINSHNQTGTLASKFLAIGRLWKDISIGVTLFRLFELDFVHNLDSGLLIKLSDKVHTKARDILQRLKLWDSLATTMRRYASFLPEVLECLWPALDVPELLLERRDCLGRYQLLRHLDGKRSEYTEDMIEIIQWYLDKTTPVNTEENDSIVRKLNEQDILGRTALHVACQNGYSKLVTELLRLGASPLSTTVLGSLPLHHAAARGSTEICSKLLSTQKYPISWNDKLENSPLFYAVSNDHFNTAIALAKSGMFSAREEGPASASILNYVARCGATDPRVASIGDCISKYGMFPFRTLDQTEASN